MKLSVENWKSELGKTANPEKIAILSKFFKTQKGEYGYGDIFIGVTVPHNRAIAKKYYTLTLSEIHEMLNDKIHEYRLSALLALYEKYRHANDNEKQLIVDFYFTNTQYINNWDLVDLSAPKIIGEYLLNHNNIEHQLINFSNSANMWERRIAILSTFTLIKNKRFDLTLKFADKYINAPEDLINKATGWMLREIGKRDISILLKYLEKNHQNMPRTSLRYAIEKLSPTLKVYYMRKNK